MKQRWHKAHPRNVILPVRASYVEDGDYQIGLNVVKDAKDGLQLWYTPDIL